MCALDRRHIIHLLVQNRSVILIPFASFFKTISKRCLKRACQSICLLETLENKVFTSEGNKEIWEDLISAFLRAYAIMR